MKTVGKTQRSEAGTVDGHGSFRGPVTRHRSSSYKARSGVSPRPLIPALFRWILFILATSLFFGVLIAGSGFLVFLAMIGWASVMVALTTTDD